MPVGSYNHILYLGTFLVNVHMFVFGVIPHKATSLKQMQKLPGHLLFYMGSNAGSISPLTADATCYTVFIMRACAKSANTREQLLHHRRLKFEEDGLLAREDAFGLFYVFFVK
jgi:hypothetical protein